jgi:DNA-directed RNA polymerase subunit omega
MARVTVEDSVESVDGNRFALVFMATRRVRQLMAGALPRVPGEKNKAPVIALREIADGKVQFDRSLKDALRGKFNPKVRPTILRPARDRSHE